MRPWHEGLPRDRPARWALLSHLVEEWFPKAAGSEASGDTYNDIVAAEHRLGIAFPDSLREWYLTVGNRADVWNVQDRLLSPNELQLDGDRVIIARENQDVVQWSVEVASLGHVDPPVMVSDPSDQDVHHLGASSVTEFALQMLVLNAKFSGRKLFRANGQVTEDAVAVIERHLPRLPFGDLHWPPFPTRLYGDDDIFTEVDGRTWVWITARSAFKFDAVVKLAQGAGVEWDLIERPH